MQGERLQKILAHAGVASRRKAEQLIVEGRVTVNGSVITELGTRADFSHDHIKVDGKLLHAAERPVYIVLHKPRNYMTTVSDPEGRPTVLYLLRGIRERVYPVGRLDYMSEGLLLLTNDGEFANRITAASSHVAKTYLVKVNGTLTPEQESTFRNGVVLLGKKTAPAGLKQTRRASNPWYEVRLIEGRQNQIRLMFHHFGYLVEKLKRVRVGFLELGRLRPGEFRHLSRTELERFRKVLKMEEARP
jgi:23S rRNA pseudouridine2605 synthase